MVFVGTNPDWEDASTNANTGVLFATQEATPILDHWLRTRDAWAVEIRELVRKGHEDRGFYGDVEGLMKLLRTRLGTFRLIRIPRIAARLLVWGCGLRALLDACTSGPQSWSCRRQSTTAAT